MKDSTNSHSICRFPGERRARARDACVCWPPYTKGDLRPPDIRAPSPHPHPLRAAPSLSARPFGTLCFRWPGVSQEHVPKCPGFTRIEQVGKTVGEGRVPESGPSRRGIQPSLQTRAFQLAQRMRALLSALGILCKHLQGCKKGVKRV